MKTLSDLKPGESAVIASCEEAGLSLRLLEMGCVPGETVTFRRRAPMGDPINISVAGYSLSLRRAEASAILLQPERK